MRRLAWLLAGIFLIHSMASAEPLAPDRVPEPLKPWIDWVLSDQEESRCPFTHGASSRVCAWPSELHLTIDDDLREVLRRYAERMER